MRFLLILVVAVSGWAAGETRRWTVGGVVREARIEAPRRGERPAPLVFVFHGHGGTMDQAAASFRLHEHWPEAVVVYPQGLPTPGRLTDAAGRRAGWQATAEDQGGRDLAFFDAMLATLRATYAIDARRIFATGHSNGGGFTYLLWAHRGNVLAAVAPSGAVAAREDQGRLAPKPVLHIAGRKDRLVRFAWQEEQVARLRRGNGGQVVETWFYDGGHRLPAEAGRRIGEFFRAIRVEAGR